MKFIQQHPFNVVVTQGSPVDDISSAGRIQYAGRCIFCGGKGLTREHIYAQWMRDVLPNFTGTTHETSIGLRLDSNQRDIFLAKDKSNKSGAPRSRRLKVVCGPCNRHWMSRLQSDAKGYLKPLLIGFWTRLSLDAQLAIASWTCMFTIVYERAHIPTAAVYEQYRREFMDFRMPPAGWAIWLGRADDSLAGQAFATHRGISRKNIVEASQVDAMRHHLEPDCQVTIAAPGKVCFVTFFSRIEAHRNIVFTAELDSIAANLGFRRIWPTREQPIFEDPSPTHGVTRAEAHDLVEAFTRVCWRNMPPKHVG